MFVKVIIVVQSFNKFNVSMRLGEIYNEFHKMNQSEDVDDKDDEWDVNP